MLSRRVLQDLFLPKLWFWAFFPGVLGLIFGLIFAGAGGSWVAGLLSTSGYDNPWLMGFAAALFFLLSLPLIYALVIALLGAFMVPAIVRVVQPRHYPHLKLQTNFSLPRILKQVWRGIRVLGLALLVAVPLFFLPGTQIFSGAILFGAVCYAVMPYDVLMDFLNDAEIEKLLAQETPRLRVFALVSAFLPLVPILGFFAPFLTALVLTHLLMEKAPMPVDTKPTRP